MNDLAKKTLLLLVITFLYFSVIKQTRDYSSTRISLILNNQNEQVENIIAYKSAIYFTVSDYVFGKNKLGFKFPFGMFFLISVYGLILLDCRLKSHFWLAMIHLVFLFIALINMWMGVVYSDIFLLVTDFISRYLILPFSFGYVSLVYLKKIST